MFAEGVATAIEVVYELGMIALEIVGDIIEGAISVITAFTGFIWDVFTTVIQQPLVWAAITAVGTGVAFVNPLAGAVVAGIGAIGTAITL